MLAIICVLSAQPAAAAKPAHAAHASASSIFRLGDAALCDYVLHNYSENCNLQGEKTAVAEQKRLEKERESAKKSRKQSRVVESKQRSRGKVTEQR